MVNQSQQAPYATPTAYSAFASSLLQLVRTLARQKMLVLCISMVALVAATTTYLFLPPKYISRASIMPPQQQSSSVSAMLSQLGGLGGAAGSIAGLKNPNDVYVGMLQSRSVADNLIGRFKLKVHYDSMTADDARKQLRKRISIASGKDGIIFIDVEDKDSKFAAELANAFVSELSIMTQKFAITEAAQRRLFFERQLRAARESLAGAEQSLRATQEATGMLQLNGQVQSIIAAAAQLKALIAAKEVEMSAIRSFATDKNPEVIRINEELRGMRAQLQKLEHGQSADKTLTVPAENIPQVAVEHVRRVRDVKYYETLVELLAKQFELAKIDEAKDAPTIQQLDIAVPAEEEKPLRRAFATAGVLIAGLLMSLLAASAKDYQQRGRHSV